MPNDRNAKRFSLLLVEPYTLVRSTVASVARSLDLVDIHETPSVDAAANLVRAQAFDGFVIALGDDQSALELVSLIRSGGTSSPATAAVAITTERVDQGSIEKLRQLEIKRVLLKPFKVKTVLETISAFAQQPATDTTARQ